MATKRNGALTAIKRILWIASTPLALSFLLAQPVAAQEGAPAAEAHHAEAAAHEGDHGGGHHGPPKNPIQNFANFSYSGKDTEGGPYEPEKGDHKMPAPFSMALLNFGVLVFLIGKFAAPNFKKMVQLRHDEVAKQLAESAKLRDEAKAKLDEYNRKVSDLDSEINKLVEQIRAEADHDKKRIIADAEERAARMRKEAEQQIQAEIARVKAQLEREATLAAINAAEKLLAEKTTEADHRALNEKFVEQLAAARPRA
jgi:F-type H+-transporting ATPase subunit b